MKDLANFIVSLFDDAGRKIRGYAVGLFIISCVFLALAAVATIVTGLQEGILGFAIGVFVAMFELILGVFGAYVLSLYLVGFGDLVHETTENRAINAAILQQLMKNDVQTTSDNNLPKAAVPAPVVKEKPQVSAQVKTDPPRIADNEIVDTYWICENCNTKNLMSRNDCWACGNKK